jgi:hypothetical protein
MAIDRIESKPAHRASQSVERATHVERCYRNKHPHRRRQTQHERRASSTLRNVATETSSPNSTRAPATSSTYRPVASTLWLPAFGTSSTSPRARDAGRGLRRRIPPPAPQRSKFSCHAFNDRPSMPWARAHSAASRPPRLAAKRHRFASLSSLIFLRLATYYLRVAHEPARKLRRDHPGVADGSLRTAT